MLTYSVGAIIFHLSRLRVCCIVCVNILFTKSESLLFLVYYLIFDAFLQVDMYSLKRMTERDLKEMGIPMVYILIN